LNANIFEALKGRYIDSTNAADQYVALSGLQNNLTTGPRSYDLG
jgi:hypothetical protein